MYAMITRKINRLFPLRKLFTILLILITGLELAVIIYNHFSGFFPLQGFSHFLLRLARGIVLTLPAGFMIAIPDLILIHYLNRFFPWGTSFVKRIILQLITAIIVAGAAAIMVTLVAHWIKAYSEDLNKVLIYNSLIGGVVNIILMGILEAGIFFEESHQARLKAEKLEKELSQIRFEVLKSQINPHFLFNSLNVLSGLIEKDISRAQLFIDEFSHIYRYVLETIEKTVVMLQKELDFARSYMFLQKIRYGESLLFSVNLPAEILHWLLPPLSLQVVLENAIKHNIVNESQPLKIEVYFENSWLVIKNNIQPKISSNSSTGTGQNNMVKRYAMIGEKIPRFTVETNHYTAKLPLIENDDNESSDY